MEFSDANHGAIREMSFLESVGSKFPGAELLPTWAVSALPILVCLLAVRIFQRFGSTRKVSNRSITLLNGNYGLEGGQSPALKTATEEEREAVAELGIRLRKASAVDGIPGGERWLEDTELLRFIRARRNVAESERLFKEAMEHRRAAVQHYAPVHPTDGSYGEAYSTYLSWSRRKSSAQPPKWWSHINSTCSMRFYGSDSNGLPILYNAVGDDDLAGIVKEVGFEAFERYGVMMNDYFLDAARAQTKSRGNAEPVHGGYVIIDLHNLSFRHMSDARIFTKMTAVVKLLHPERQLHAYIVRTPRFFTGIWSVIRQFIDRRTLAKITILSPTDSLQPIFDTLGAKNVPDCLGGTFKM